jgi:hypothetical protein
MYFSQKINNEEFRAIHYPRQMAIYAKPSAYHGLLKILALALNIWILFFFPLKWGSIWFWFKGHTNFLD